MPHLFHEALVDVVEEAFRTTVREHLAEYVEQLFLGGEAQLGHKVFVLFGYEVAQLLLYLFQLFHEVGSLRLHEEHLI